MLLEILWALERLAAEFTLVRFERDVDTYVRSDMISLDSRGAAASPLTGEIEVVGRLAANMALADMFLVMRLATRSGFGLVKGLGALRRESRAWSSALRSLATDTASFRRRCW